MHTKTNSSEVAWALLTEGVSSSRLKVHRLKQMFRRALALVESSAQKDHLYAVAGDVIQGMPSVISALETDLDRTSLALSKMGDDFLSARLPKEDKDTVDNSLTPAFGGSKSLRSSVNAVVGRFLSRRADLSPPLGHNPCDIITRAERQLRDPLKSRVINELEDGRELSKQDNSALYKTFIEQGPGGPITKMRLSPHAQYRMDLRGIDVEELRDVLNRWVKSVEKMKASQSRQYMEIMQNFEATGRITHQDPRTNIKIVFTPSGNGTADIITVMVKGKEDPVLRCPKK